MGPHTIQPQTALPKITDSVLLDGISLQVGAACGGNLMIVLDFSAIGGIGLDFTKDADGSTVRGIVINGANDGIEVNACDDFTVSCCYIGTNSNASVAVPNTRYGIYVLGETHNFTLGGVNSSEGNVISGNDNLGVRFYNRAHSNIIIENNKVGVDLFGLNPIANGSSGIQIDGIGSNNLSVKDNVISSNNTYGVYVIDFDTITFEGNKVGTDINGSNNLGNGNNGLYLRRCQNYSC